MAEWSILNWLDAGHTPLLVIIVLVLWRLERRLLKLELAVETLKADFEELRELAAGRRR